MAMGAGDLLVETHGPLASLARDVRATFAGEPPDFVERTRAEMAKARHEFLVARADDVRWELEALAPSAYPAAAAEQLVAAARERGPRRSDFIDYACLRAGEPGARR